MIVSEQRLASQLSSQASNSIPLKTEWNIRPKGSSPMHCERRRTSQDSWLVQGFLHGRLATELYRIGPAVLKPPLAVWEPFHGVYSLST